MLLPSSATTGTYGEVAELGALACLKLPTTGAGKDVGGRVPPERVWDRLAQPLVEDAGDDLCRGRSYLLGASHCLRNVHRVDAGLEVTRRRELTERHPWVS